MGGPGLPLFLRRPRSSAPARPRGAASSRAHKRSRLVTLRCGRHPQGTLHRRNHAADSPGKCTDLEFNEEDGKDSGCLAPVLGVVSRGLFFHPASGCLWNASNGHGRVVGVGGHTGTWTRTTTALQAVPLSLYWSHFIHSHDRPPGQASLELREVEERVPALPANGGLLGVQLSCWHC